MRCGMQAQHSPGNWGLRCPRKGTKAAARGVGVSGQAGRVCHSPGLIQAPNNRQQDLPQIQAHPDTPNTHGRCGAFAPPWLEDPIVLRDLL